ncbi:unnamed protein product [Echinostoma caproni]|uniref:Legumain n=1 Tax=Echinostoma caproni TaxID=27848 RepID=A0A183AUQ3_9TREM|nr:unnamed protein product [Echinostoma caproni]
MWSNLEQNILLVRCFSSNTKSANFPPHINVYIYSEQADVSHAYQLLRRNGIPVENIVTIMYDDVANCPDNPFPGKLFNDYEHHDVYHDVVVDYRGEDVTPENFIGVLLGDAKLKSTGKKVLESGPDDDVFIFFTDHGAPNMICFPNKDVILAVTAANSHESSMGCFCDDKLIDTCLADEYSYRWITDSEKAVEYGTGSRKMHFIDDSVHPVGHLA